MATQVFMKHPVGVIKKSAVGFSWTVFLFGFWPPLFRGDIKWFSIGLVISIINSVLLSSGNPAGIIVGFLVTLFWWFYFAIKYNEWHMEGLLLAGYKKFE